MKPRFISLEGSEGCGKSTQLAKLHDKFEALGHRVFVTREPGGTPLGETLRHLLKHAPEGEGMCPESELLLFAASRAQLVRSVLRPTLQRGDWVLADRYADSTTVYQGIARGLAPDQVAAVNAMATDGLWPSLTVIFQLSPEDATGRLRRRPRPVGQTDRMEAQSPEFFDKVRAGYQSIAEGEPQRVKIIDGAGLRTKCSDGFGLSFKMSFQFNEIVERFRSGATSRRLGHAYLLTGTREDEIERLGDALAEIAMGESPKEHPDFHLVRPESKSRRITIAQMRDLERALYLKPFRSPTKIGFVLAAERMCLGQAEAANAFLKTLEEPPASTLLFLGSTRPQMLLPTIISRCLRLDLASPDQEPDEALAALVSKWFDLDLAPPLRAYARASLLAAFWNEGREGIAERYAEMESAEEADEDAIKAMIEGEFQFLRQDSLGYLQRRYWSEAEKSGLTGEARLNLVRSVQALEDLSQAFQHNIEQGLAVERACLAAEGLL